MTSEQQRPGAFRLDQRGLARVFGELEAAVMDTVWRLGEPTVGEVCRALGTGANYKTVMTVMNRLVEKKALRRRRGGRAFLYAATESREVFMGRISRSVVDGLLQDFGDVAVAQFVDALDDVDPALLERLAELVRVRSATEGQTT